MGARIIIITPPNVNAPSPMASQKQKDDWVAGQLQEAVEDMESPATPNAYTYTIETV